MVGCGTKDDAGVIGLVAPEFTHQIDRHGHSRVSVAQLLRDPDELEAGTVGILCFQSLLIASQTVVVRPNSHGRSHNRCRLRRDAVHYVQPNSWRPIIRVRSSGSRER